MQTRSIEIEKHDRNGWTVREGERFCPHLCWDEMLGMLVTLTHQPGTPHYGMPTIGEHLHAEAQREERLRQMRADQEPEQRVRNAAPELLDVVKRGRRKLATYVSVYPGDKELRGLLAAWDAAITKAEGSAS